MSSSDRAAGDPVERLLVRWRTRYLAQQLAAFREVADLVWQAMGASCAAVALDTGSTMKTWTRCFAAVGLR